MAANSKREQIIISDFNLVQAVPSIKSPIRTLPEYAELTCYAQTQFPVCAVVGRMPVPNEKFSQRGVAVDQIRSEIKVDIFVYLQVNEDADSLISSVADDLFKQLYTDESRGKLVYETTIKIKEKVNIWNPFVAFQMTAIHKYIHDTGGI